MGGGGGEGGGGVEKWEGYATDRVNRAEGDVARFDALFEEYRKAPEVTRKRLYLETLGKVLPKAGKKVVVDKDVKSVLPLLNLDTAAVAATKGGDR